MSANLAQTAKDMILEAEDDENHRSTAPAAASTHASADAAMDLVSEDGGADASVDDKKQSIARLVEMGFSSAQAEKAISVTKTVEEACNWLSTADESTLNAADSSAANAQTAKSYKCVETGKLFRTMTDAMIYAERTGHSNFEESSEEIPALTAEERAERLVKVKQLIADKAARRAEAEKKEEQQRERLRRAGGQQMAKVREEQEIMQRKRDAELREAEKERFRKEQERLREDVALDKARRAMEKAKRLNLGDPQKAYDEAYQKAKYPGGTNVATEKTPEERVEACLKVFESFRLGGKGLECVRVLKKLLGNVVANPGEAKFRKVSMHNETFKNKVGSLPGGIAVLKASGFVEIKDANDVPCLVLPSDADLGLVASILGLVTAAEASGRYA